jgi:hypothetical protein
MRIIVLMYVPESNNYSKVIRMRVNPISHDPDFDFA